MNVKTFAGMKYMPLRDLFQSIEETPKQYDLLITTGGTDPFHVSLKLLEEILSKKTFDEFSICVILGRFNEDEELIRELIVKHNAKSPKTKITVLKNINNMKEIMCASKFAVSSGGTTVYELMACGVPFVCFGFSDDQVLFGERLGQHGNAFWGGDIRNNSCFTLDLLNSVEKLISLPAHEIKQLKEKNQNIVDGKGAARIADILISLEKK